MEFIWWTNICNGILSAFCRWFNLVEEIFDDGERWQLRSIVKVLIFLEVGRIFMEFFRELTDAMELCLFLKLIQVGCRNIWRRRTMAASFSGVKVLIIQEVGRIFWNFFGELIRCNGILILFEDNSSWMQKYLTMENDGSFVFRSKALNISRSW